MRRALAGPALSVLYGTVASFSRQKVENSKQIVADHTMEREFRLILLIRKSNTVLSIGSNSINREDTIRLPFQ